MSRLAAVLAFPTGRLTMQDRADLARWSSISGRYGWRVGAEGGPPVETTRDGREHVRITLRALDDDAVYFVARARHGWSVLDRRGADYQCATLRAALESICPTVWQGAASDLAAPGQPPGLSRRQRGFHTWIGCAARSPPPGWCATSTRTG